MTQRAEQTTGGSTPPPRLDAYLVARGLARSRGQARELIASGAVTLDGRVVTRPSQRVAPGSEAAARVDTWVGRAAHKLLAALDIFGGHLRGLSGARCLDIGASTGGFTQVLLAQGVDSVVALDVGHGQLSPLLAGDRRVVERSGVNVRGVAPGDLGEPFDLVVADLSFISLRLVLPVIAEQLAPRGEAIVLIKPQFEVGRQRLGKGGVVRSEHHRTDAVRLVLLQAGGFGLSPIGLARSPLPGTSGNMEYLALLRHSSDDGRPAAAVVHDVSCTKGTSCASTCFAGATGIEALAERLIDDLDHLRRPDEGIT